MDDNMKERLTQLAGDEEFLQKLGETESFEDVAELFTEQGVEITAEELKAAMADEPEGELDEAALSEVAGGVSLIDRVRILIGIFRPIGPGRRPNPKKKR